jgi:hypothetical protein
MSDTQLAVIGMIAAFVTASLADTVKTLILEEVKRRRLRRMLYTEIGMNAVDLESVIYHSHVAFVDRELPSISIECYRYAKGPNIDLFFGLSEVNVINRLYYALERLLLFHDEKGTATDGSAELWGTQYLMDLANALLRGYLDKSLMRKAIGDGLFSYLTKPFVIEGNRTERVSEPEQSHTDNSGEAPPGRNPADTSGSE